MHPYSEAGRRLKAAMISYRIGRVGVDSTLKEISDDPGPGWSELAEVLDHEMTDQIEARLRPKSAERGPGLSGS
jgi:hypothetical protein